MNIFTNEEQYKIIDLYKKSTSIDELIYMFNSCEHDIRVILKENSIDRVYNTFSDELYQRIITLYQQKCTQKEICYRLLVSEHAIRKTLKRNNIPMRTYSENNRKYELDEHYFDTIDTQNKAYILGLFWADGCNHLGHYSITLCLQEDDKEVVEFVKNELKYEGPISYIKLSKKNKNHKNQYKLCINDEYMSKKLNELGMVQAKSLVAKFPECVPEKLYSHFIRGVFDGDGCIYYDEKRNKCTTETVGTNLFCEKCSDILHGIQCKHYLYRSKKWNDSTMSFRTTGNKSSEIFLDWIYNDAEFYMKRKHDKYLYFKQKYSEIKKTISLIKLTT